LFSLSCIDNLRVQQSNFDCHMARVVAMWWPKVKIRVRDAFRVRVSN